MSVTLGEVGRLIVTFGADRTEFSNDLRATNNEARSVLGGLQDYANKGFTGLKNVVGAGMLGGLGLVAGGFGALAANMSDSTALAKIQRDAETQLAAVLESTGHAAGLTADQLKSMASGLQNVTNFGDEAIIGGQNLLLTFTNIGQDVFPMATETMLDMSQALGQSLKSSSIQLGKALNDPIKGVSALAEVGVSFTEQQKEQIKAMTEAGDVAGAQKMILAELAREFGGSARAMADPAVQAGNAWGDFKEVIGGVALEFKDRLAGAALPLVSAATVKASNFIGEFSQQLKDGASPLEAIRQALSDTFDSPAWLEGIVNAANVVTNLKDRALELLAPIIEAVGQFVSWKDVLVVLGGVAIWIVGSALAPLVGAIAATIAITSALVAGVALLRNAWESDFLGMRTALTGFWDEKVKPAFESAQMWMGENLPTAIATLQDFWENKLLPAIKAVWGFIDKYLMPLFSALVNVAFAALKVELAVLQALFENVLMPALRTVWGFVKDHIIPIFDGMSGSIGGIVGVIQSVIGWLGQMADKLTSVADRIPDLFRPGSPTPFEIGFRGIADAMGEARSAAQGLTSGFGLAAAGASAGGDVINIPIQQQFYGQADTATVYRAAGAGAMSVQQLRRRRGG